MVSDNNKTTNLSQKVMDRIIEENKWTKPVHEQKNRTSKHFKTISSFLLILVLLGITISFIFINPTPKNINAEIVNENVISTIKSIDSAKTFTHLDFLIVNQSMISNIGEPYIYIPNKKAQNDSQLFWILTIFSISIIILFLSWISKKDDNPNYT